jgi:alkylation response protein AidB-like acyl-CoA dehydrogenase
VDLELNEAQADAQRVARESAVELLAPAAAGNDLHERFPTETLKELGRRGLMGVNVAAEWGGRAAGGVAYAVAVRELAAECAATTVALMVTNMVAEAIQAEGSDAQKAKYLPGLCGGTWPAGAFSLSEPGAGSDAAGLRTTAVRDGDHYVLNGTKAWVTSGGHCGVYLVMARTDPEARSRGISTFLIDPDTPGFSVPTPEDKMGLRGSATTELVFEQCRVPETARLGPEGIGFKIAMRALDGGRIGVSAQACGIATGALRHATQVLKGTAPDARGPDYPDKLRLLADAATELDAGWLMCLRAASLKDAGKPFSQQAAMSKLFCTEMANRVCQRALTIIGPEAYLRGPVEQRLRDVRITRIYEGTSEVQRLVIARQLVSAAS